MSGNHSQAPVPLLLEAYVTRLLRDTGRSAAQWLLHRLAKPHGKDSWLVWKNVTTSYITSCDPQRSIYPDVYIYISIYLLYIYIYYTIYAYILSIQHIFWQGSDILSDIFSDMLSYCFLGIIPDIRHYVWRLFYLAFFPGIIIFSHFIWQSIWHLFWHAILTFKLTFYRIYIHIYIYSGSLSGILSDIFILLITMNIIINNSNKNNNSNNNLKSSN